MATDTDRGVIVRHDDFDELALDTTNVGYSTNADAGGTAFAINEQRNGVIRGSVDTTDNDITNIFGVPLYRADAGGPLKLEVRAALITSIADGETYIGWTDDDGTDENPLTLSTADVLTSNATDGCGFMYTGGGTANWKVAGVKNGSDTAVVACDDFGATTPVAATFQTFTIILDAAGNAEFFINGHWQASVANAVTATTLLSFGAAIQSGGTARSLDIDYVRYEVGRA